jgi:fimbrial chaperone protein
MPRSLLSLFARWRVIAIAIALAAAGSSAVYAMRVSPMIVEMVSTGSGATARIEVQNLNQANLPFETRISRIHYDENGVATETPADGDFLVFPPQGILPPGARQVIRVQWVGAPDLAASQAYYLSVNQLPVPVGQAAQGAVSAQVQIVYHMKALIVVAPPGATPNVTAASAQAIDYQPPAAAPGGPLPPKVPGIAITLRNTGKRHAMMAAFKWVVSGTGRDGHALRIVFTQDDLSRLVGSGYVGPLDTTRIFKLPVPTPFGPGPIAVRFIQ